ncbi:hypothetical protein WJX84_005601 [Apatococcus fuscideae]|uniref:NADP-dependent oxidoreductase domain-containing protein n=1 Tax=Apatococcus fuscideae TaxID=2026836 RepID=A0AAW1THD1_9CHLO
MCLSGFHLDQTTQDGKTREEEGIHVLHRTMELGITHLDTSNVYGPCNEVLVGKAIAGRKLDCLATKSAFKITSAGFGMDGSREYVRSAVGKSLKWLDVKQIDLYYQHWVDRTLPIEDTWKALKEQLQGAKSRTRDAEADVIPTCRGLGIGIVAYSPPGRGLF